ncbi:MAG TPA: T9SS type A sorting domain-containing protein [Ignavibacteriales bacterium]|nr:T9SS type A sorting domain-containing protein [Ignavibacteriales bacterium]
MKHFLIFCTLFGLLQTALYAQKGKSNLWRPDTLHMFSLSQNYPDPFNSSTTINFSVKQDGMVRLSVYNILGSRVAVILDAYKPAGDYSVRYNGDKLPGGVYFYKLESGGRILTKKFILLK